MLNLHPSTLSCHLMAETSAKSQMYKFSILAPEVYCQAVKNAEPIKENDVSYKFGLFLKRWSEEVFGMSCYLPSKSGEAFIEDFNRFEDDFLAKSEYCIIIISEVAARALRRFLARLLVFVTMRSMWRNRFIFIALGEFEGLRRLDLEVSLHELIVFKSSTEEEWMVETECWKALYLILNISWASSVGANSDLKTSAKSAIEEQAGAVTESVEQLDKSFKLILLTSNSYSKASSGQDADEDSRGEAFAQFLQHKSESEFQMSCKIPSSSGGAFITDFDKFENEFLRVSEYCLIIVSEESVRSFRIFLPRLLVFLTRRSGWSNRFIIACVGNVDLRESEVDFLTHPPLYFTSTEAESWSMEVRTWQILYRILRITWMPTDAESRLAKIAFDSEAFYHTVVFTSVFYSTSAQEQPDDCTGWQFGSYFTTKMSLEYKFMVYVLTARDAVQVESLDELEVTRLKNCGNLVFIVTKESARQFTQFCIRLQQFLASRIEWRDRLTLICVGDVHLDEDQLSIFGSSVIKIYSSERSSWTSISSDTWNILVRSVQQTEIVAQEQLVEHVSSLPVNAMASNSINGAAAKSLDVQSTRQTSKTSEVQSGNTTEKTSNVTSTTTRTTINTITTSTTSSIDVEDSSAQEIRASSNSTLKCSVEQRSIEQEEERKRQEQMRQEERKRQEREEEHRRQEQMRQEEERKRQEQERQEEERKRQEQERLEQERKRQEQERQEEERKRQEQERLEQERKRQEQERQEEERKRQEQERQEEERKRQEQERLEKERKRQEQKQQEEERKRQEQERQEEERRRQEQERLEQERKRQEQERLEQERKSQSHSQTVVTTIVTETTAKRTEEEKVNVASASKAGDGSNVSDKEKSEVSRFSSGIGRKDHVIFDVDDAGHTRDKSASSVVLRVIRTIHTRIVRITVFIHSTTVVVITRTVRVVGVPVRVGYSAVLKASRSDWMVRLWVILRRVLRVTTETIRYVSGSQIAVASGDGRVDVDLSRTKTDRHSQRRLLPAWLARILFYASGRFIACRAETEAGVKQTLASNGVGSTDKESAASSALLTVTDWRDANCAICHQLVVDGLARVRRVGDGCPYNGASYWAAMTRRAYYWSDVISDRLHVYSRRRAVAHGFLCAPFLAAGPGLLEALRAACVSLAGSAVYIGQAEPTTPVGATLDGGSSATVAGDGGLLAATGPVWINPLLYRKAATETERELFAARYNRRFFQIG